MDKKTKLFIIAQVVIIALFAFLAIGCFGSSYSTDSYYDYDDCESKDYMHDAREEQKRKEEEKDRESRQYYEDRKKFNDDYQRRHNNIW